MKKNLLAIFFCVMLGMPAVALASSASVQGLAPASGTAAAGAAVSFSIEASGFSSPAYSISDSFSGSSITGADIDGNGNFSWTPSGNDLGKHIITVTVLDSSGDSAQAQAQMFVTAPASVSIASLLPGAEVKAGQTVTFRAVALGFAGPLYSVSDSLAGSTLAASDISNSGYFSWTPQAQDAGTHVLTISVNDLIGHSTSTDMTLTVDSAPAVVVQGAPSSAIVGSAAAFKLSAPGFTVPVYSLHDSFIRSSVTSADLDASGNFSWTPAAGDIGTHTLVFTASDSYAHVADTVVEITVASGAAAQTQTHAQTQAASGLSQTQIQAILSLLQSFGADQATIGNVSAALGGGGTQTAANYTFTQALSVGSTGAEVAALQQELASLGYFSGAATGYFGQLTQAALKQFQSARGLEAVGYVGPATRAALNQ